jgi:hypothetical protein
MVEYIKEPSYDKLVHFIKIPLWLKEANKKIEEHEKDLKEYERLKNKFG